MSNTHRGTSLKQSMRTVLKETLLISESYREDVLRQLLVAAAPGLEGFMALAFEKGQEAGPGAENPYKFEDISYD